MKYKIFNMTEGKRIDDEEYDDREKALARCKELAKKMSCYFTIVCAAAE